MVQSLHKTLPCLTQTAILHWNSEIIPWQEVARQTAIFQSSSPSYLFTAAMDGCVNYVEEHGAEAFERWINLLRLFDREAEKLAAVAHPGPWQEPGRAAWIFREGSVQAGNICPGKRTHRR